MPVSPVQPHEPGGIRNQNFMNSGYFPLERLRFQNRLNLPDSGNPRWFDDDSIRLKGAADLQNLRPKISLKCTADTTARHFHHIATL